MAMRPTSKNRDSAGTGRTGARPMRARASVRRCLINRSQCAALIRLEKREIFHKPYNLHSSFYFQVESINKYERNSWAACAISAQSTDRCRGKFNLIRVLKNLIWIKFCRTSPAYDQIT
jgi:hypothetical protein